MLEPRSVLYITDYEFEEQVARRNKYLIVLHFANDQTILVSLTTSKIHVPQVMLHSGKTCLRDEQNNIHSYFFEATKVIGDNGFNFPVDTCIDINKSQVFFRSIVDFSAKYIETGYAVQKGFLTEAIYYDLLYCISKGRHIPKGIQRQLEAILEVYYSQN
ncbi:MAG: hypothetical protein ACRCYO_02025 [Bacteroidia bacterium]